MLFVQNGLIEFHSQHFMVQNAIRIKWQAMLMAVRQHSILLLLKICRAFI